MELTDTDLSTSLQKALTCYLAFLSHSQKIRESRLPRQGKGIETTTDLSTLEDHRRHVAATETCLQYTSKIARKVRRWYRDEVDPGIDENVDNEPDTEILGTFLEQNTDSFVDPFTGKWIQDPKTSFAGKSSNSDEAPHIDTSDLTSNMVQQPYLTQQHREIAHEYLERKARSRGSRPSLGLHPNLPISLSIASSTNEDQNSSVRSSRTSAISPITPATSVSTHSINSPVVTTKMHASPYVRSAQEARDNDVKRKIADDAGTRQEIEKAASYARRLARRKAREEDARRYQEEEDGREQERKNRERAERIREQRIQAEKVQASKDKQAREAELRRKALEAKREIEREEKRREEKREARRERHRRQREEEEDAYKEQRRLRKIEVKNWEDLQAQKSWQRKEEIDRLNAIEAIRLIAERDRKVTFRRRPSPSTGDERRRSEINDKTEPYRKSRNVEKSSASKSKQVDCVSCMESGNQKEMAILPCDHPYCTECIRGAIQSACNSHEPFKCCGKTISTAKLTARLPSTLRKQYDLLLLELSTKKPLYCASPTCSKFIPPSLIHGPIAACTTCKFHTCIACRKEEHSGVCKEDKEGQKVEELAKKKGWKQCPKCNQILERTEGCLHMTCRCRAEWCYACLRDWDVCRSTCGRDTTPGAALGVNFMGIGNRADDFYLDNRDPFLVRGAHEDMLRRALNNPRQRMMEDWILGTQPTVERREMTFGVGIGGAGADGGGRRGGGGAGGILPAVAVGLMMAMFDRREE